MTQHPTHSHYPTEHPSPNGRPPRQTSTTRIILIVAVVFGAFYAASTIASMVLGNLIFLGLDRAVEKITEVPAKRDVAVGEPFTLDGFAVDAGWQVTKTKRGGVQITGLRVTYTEDYPRMASQRFFFSKDGTVLAEVSCGIYEDLEHGETAELPCEPSDEPYPSGYDRLQVRDTF